jgi:hypothetical protein
MMKKSVEEKLDEGGKNSHKLNNNNNNNNCKDTAT